MDSQSRYSQHGDSGDDPIYSRLFVVYDRKLTKDDLENAFKDFGVIEYIKLPLDQNGSPKGVGFIKFSKTSEAANAMEAMDNKYLPGSGRRLKLQIAANRSEIEKPHEDDREKYKRLFLHTPRNMSENEIEDVFGKFGFLQSVVIQRDHKTGDSKGFAYVTYSKFSEAAKAYEECERMYRPVFAKPKNPRRPMTSFESNIGALASSSSSSTPLSMISMMGNECRNDRKIFNKVKFMCCPHVTQWQIGKLFDLIPGMENCQYHVDLYHNCGKGTVIYNNPTSAAYAVQKLNEFEYPPGMTIYVRPDDAKNIDEGLSIKGVPVAVAKLKTAIENTQSGTPDLAELAEAIAHASKLIKMATGNATEDAIPDSNDINYCSVQLPPPQQLAHIDSPVAKRCFLVCKPAPPPLSVLRDVFCRFGDLINVYTLPNKTVGYARYASVASADQAMKFLHGAEVCGVRMKVLEAEEEAPPKKRRFDN